MGKHFFYSFNLKDQIEFDVNIDLKKVGSACDDPTALILNST